MRKLKTALLLIVSMSSTAFAITSSASMMKKVEGLSYLQKEYIEVNGVEVKKTINATGNEIIVINGVDNVITITGECSEIIVAGSGHTVLAEGVKTIKVEGTNNTVKYKKATSSDGRLNSSISGVDNKIEKVN